MNGNHKDSKEMKKKRDADDAVAGVMRRVSEQL